MYEANGNQKFRTVVVLNDLNVMKRQKTRRNKTFSDRLKSNLSDQTSLKMQHFVQIET